MSAMSQVHLVMQELAQNGLSIMTTALEEAEHLADAENRTDLAIDLYALRLFIQTTPNLSS